MESADDPESLLDRSEGLKREDSERRWQDLEYSGRVGGALTADDVIPDYAASEKSESMRLMGERIERLRRDDGTPRRTTPPTLPEFDEDLIPDIGRSDFRRSPEDEEVDALIDGFDLADAYRRYIGKMDPKVGKLRESVMISCPMPGHVDANPSAWMNLDKGVWCCAVCDRGGDVYDLAAIGKGYNLDTYKTDGSFLDLRRAIAEDLGFTLRRRRKLSPTRKDGKQPGAAAWLVDAAKEQYQLGRTRDGDAFAVALTGANLALPLVDETGGLGHALRREYHQKTGKTVSSGAMSDALGTLRGYAELEDAQDLPLRVGRDGANIILDLGAPDGAACVVTADGWDIVGRSPITFKRSVLTEELPRPTRGGSLVAFRNLLNIDLDSWELLRSYLVAAWVPDICHPIVYFRGEQGTGKTTAARLVVRLLDPCVGELRAAPAKLNDWAVAANASWVVGVDNLTSIESWYSDALCRAVTGETLVNRALYTDKGLSVLNLRRVIILTAIDAGATRGDLGERLLPLELMPITGADRRSEIEVLRSFDSTRPATMGALLDLVVEALRALPGVTLTETPRMADTAAVFAAVDRVKGSSSLERFTSVEASVAREVVDGDPVALAVETFALTKRRWEGTTAELLDELNLLAPEPSRAPDWPTRPVQLGRRLTRVSADLRKVGVDVRPGHSGKGPAKRRTKVITYTGV